jgi:pimeloyl-ACP methyl ester carboxylesterase
MVSVGGVQLRVSLRPGTGFSSAVDRPPLLLCNGIGAPIEMWPPFRDRLSRPTIAFDAPGVGESSVPLIPPTIGGVARLMLKVLDHLGVPTVDVLGVSWGGALAQELAHHGGERVRRLVLCATGAGPLIVPGDPRVLAILATPLRYWSPSYLDRVAPTLYGPDATAFFGSAERIAGSWWNEWSEWLSARDGETRRAPRTLGNRAHPVLDPAPGRYAAS